MCWRLPCSIFTSPSQKAYVWTVLLFYIHFIGEELGHGESNLPELVKGGTRIQTQRPLASESPHSSQLCCQPLKLPEAHDSNVGVGVHFLTLRAHRECRRMSVQPLLVGSSARDTRLNLRRSPMWEGLLTGLFTSRSWSQGNLQGMVKVS